MAQAGVADFARTLPCPTGGVLDENGRSGGFRRALLLLGADGEQLRTLKATPRFLQHRRDGFIRRQKARSAAAKRLLRLRPPFIPAARTFVFIGDGGVVDSFGGFGAKRTARAPIRGLVKSLVADQLATVVMTPEGYTSAVGSCCNARNNLGIPQLTGVRRPPSSPKDWNSGSSRARKAARLLRWKRRRGQRRGQGRRGSVRIESHRAGTQFGVDGQPVGRHVGADQAVEEAAFDPDAGRHMV